MAWYAELKRRKWYCIRGYDIIPWYKQYLYDEWYNSLTDEQKQRLEEYRKRKEEERQRQLEQSIQSLAMMTGFISSVYRPKYDYDEFLKI